MFCKMTGAKKGIHKYMVLQFSKLFHSLDFYDKIDSAHCSFGKIQNVGELELSLSISLEKDFIFKFLCIYGSPVLKTLSFAEFLLQN